MARRILITSGPTREYLDPVRFLSNASSGRMGAALARAVLERGDDAVIVSGPVAIDYPVEAEVHRVETTSEMLQRCLALFPGCDAVIGAAAPCDFRPETFSDGKIAKKPDGSPLFLKLVETPDILRTLAASRRAGQRIVAFALETDDPYERALAKLRKKGADLIVLDGPATIDAERADITLIDAAGRVLATLGDTKDRLAREILRHV